MSEADEASPPHELEGPTSEWDSVAAEWDLSEAVRTYAALAFESLEHVVSEHSIQLDGARVIDFGCGTGLLTEQLIAVGASVLAIDNSREMLAAVDRKIVERGWTMVRTSTAVAAAGDCFDLVVCSSVCGFLDDYPAVARELASKLCPGGVFVQWDWERLDLDADHGLTRSEIASALRTAGLERIDVTDDFAIDIDGETVRPLRGHGRRPVERA